MPAPHALTSHTSTPDIQVEADRLAHEQRSRQAEEALLNQLNAESEALKASLVGKRRVHREKDKEAGLGFKFKKLASGLFEISSIKEGGFAAKTGLLGVGDVVISVDGTQTEGMSPVVFSDSLMGKDGSTVDLGVQQRGQSGTSIVACTRSMMTGDDLTTPKTEALPVRSSGVEAVPKLKLPVESGTPSRGAGVGGKVCGLGFSYKVSTKDKSWRVGSIKGGWAAQSGSLQSGDLIVSVGGKETLGMELMEITKLIQGEVGTVVEIVVRRDATGETLKFEANRLKTV